MPFEKGRSGNPSGKNDRPWRDALRIAINGKVDGKRKLRLLAEKTVEMALAGDMAAVREIADRLDGKPKQEADVNVEHGLSASFLLALRAANNTTALPSPKGEILDLTPEPAESK